MTTLNFEVFWFGTGSISWNLVIAKSAIFKIWVLWMHYITLYVVDIHDIRCLEPFYHPMTTLKFWNFLVWDCHMVFRKWALLGKGLSEPQFKFKDGFAYFNCLISPRSKIQMYHTFEMQIYLHFKSVIYLNIYLVRQMIQMITVSGEGLVPEAWCRWWWWLW